MDWGGEGAGGWLVAVGGDDGFSEGRVGPLMVVDRLPGFESGMELVEGVPAGAGIEDLEIEGEVEAFFFAGGLGMERRSGSLDPQVDRANG